mmetsp:Transcript_27550/g.37883  ORF Transcript_27550/g.37883 Transcript_27550/m.37883 type:complete len:305 (+) Transcript_27550:1616-2530(+)
MEYLLHSFFLVRHRTVTPDVDQYGVGCSVWLQSSCQHVLEHLVGSLRNVFKRLIAASLFIRQSFSIVRQHLSSTKSLEQRAVSFCIELDSRLLHAVEYLDHVATSFRVATVGPHGQHRGVCDDIRGTPTVQHAFEYGLHGHLLVGVATLAPNAHQNGPGHSIRLDSSGNHAVEQRRGFLWDGGVSRTAHDRQDGGVGDHIGLQSILNRGLQNSHRQVDVCIDIQRRPSLAPRGDDAVVTHNVRMYSSVLHRSQHALCSLGGIISISLAENANELVELLQSWGYSTFESSLEPHFRAVCSRRIDG